MAARMRSICWSLYILSLFVCLGAVHCQLEKLQPKQILERIEKGCVFLLLSPKNDVLWNNFVNVTIAFKTLDSQEPSSAKNDIDCVQVANCANQTDVYIGYHDGLFSWKQSEPLAFKESVNEGTSLTNDIAFFPVRKKDRSCLLQTNQQLYPKAEVYGGEYDAESMVNFLNAKCNSFRTLEGTLNPAGKLRKNILQNVFQVKEISNYTMKKHWDGRMEITPGRHTTTTGFDTKEYCDRNSNGQSECYSEKTKGKVYKNISSPESLPRCERVSFPISEEDFFLKYLSRSKPFILEGAITHWKAFTKWTKEYLRKKYGEEEVHIKLAPDGVFEGVEDATLWEDYQSFQIPPEVSKQLPYPDLVVVRPGTAEMKFSEFSDMMDFEDTCSYEQHSNITSRVSAYLEYTSIRNYFSDLEKDLEELEMAADFLQLKHLNIWLSDGKTLGKLHFDPFDNLLCQIRGKKQLIIFEPHNNTQLYEAHIPEALLGFNKQSKTFRRKTRLDSTSMVMAPVDILNPDFERFPEFAKARPLNCTIDEGDVLFMPAFWWHEVQSYPNSAEGRNLAVNYWHVF
ncbi:putative jmjC domain-containing protein E-like [Apostichopus japonicus]|uniref:Putative jmjC domain-containing protein E-like n=1 Tax=Stichopus japonicus TaxID=307972 RepID=A0A2G8KWB6_STIJA|nr:putative jmjC domain-containing protein E-like [Apostichopus japonicus]